MNSDYLFSSPNSMVYSYPAHPNGEEHHPQSFSNTKLPVFNLGVNSSPSNVGQAGGSHLLGSRPRGRPRGSKNKPKGFVLSMTSALKSAVLEIPPGSDVVEWMKQFAQSRNICVNVLGGSGMVQQVAISHLLSHPVILAEKLTLISFSGTAGIFSPLEPSRCCSFTAALGRLNGTVVGGTLTSLITYGPVLLNVLISKNPEVGGAGYQTLA